MRTSALVTACVAVLSAAEARAQAPAEEPKAAAPVTLPAPAMSPPLTLNASPFSVDAPWGGKIYVSGQLSGLALAQSSTAPNPLPAAGNSDALADVSNGMVAIQTISGPFQFFIQAGTYSFPTLGTPYLRNGKNTEAYYGNLPIAYGKLVLSPEVSIQAGAMPTLIGSEYAFTFQNTNIERGLLWNQEPVVSKGVQVNYAKGPLSASVSLTDGFYSDNYNWLAGLVSYAIDSHNTVALNGGFNFNSTNTNKFRAPNTVSNSSILDIAYTYTNGPLWISPYLQFTWVDATPRAGVVRPAETYSGAVLAKYTFTPEINVGGRFEYIATSSSACRRSDGPFCAPTNLLYGPSSDAWSITLTPTWQRGVVFARAEFSYVRIESFRSGFGFGPAFNDRDQVRGLFETGILF